MFQDENEVIVGDEVAAETVTVEGEDESEEEVVDVETE